MKILLVLVSVLAIGCASGNNTSQDARIVTTYIDSHNNRCFYLEATSINNNEPTGTYCKE